MKEIIREFFLQEARKKKKKAGDRCTRIAKRKYKVWPSAYASGAVVKCRRGKIWKNENLEYDLEALMENTEYEDLINEEPKRDFSKEKEKGLHGWFERRGGQGKAKGWVDCNTCRDGKCKPCGRQDGEDRKKPRCRPTPSQCKGYKRPDQR